MMCQVCVDYGKNIESHDVYRIGRFAYAVFCLHYLLPYVGNVGTNGITNGTIGKALNDACVRGSPNGTIGSLWVGTFVSLVLPFLLFAPISLPMVPLATKLVQMIQMLPTNGEPPNTSNICQPLVKMLPTVRT